MSQGFPYDQQLDLFESNYQRFYENFTNKIIFLQNLWNHDYSLHETETKHVEEL